MTIAEHRRLSNRWDRPYFNSVGKHLDKFRFRNMVDWNADPYIRLKQEVNY